MNVDVVGYIGAVERKVTSSERDGQPMRVIIATRRYETPIEDLWDALTNAERIPRWFLPVSGDLRLGGQYQFEGNAGGRITRCEPPRVVAVTWEFGGSVSWVTVTLAEDPKGGTRLELEHVTPAGDHWKQFGAGAVGVGWDLALVGLALHLANGGAAVDRKEAAVWSASAEGKDFMRRSSDDWCRASIAGGADRAAALAAAKRTIAAYTGESDVGGE